MLGDFFFSVLSPSVWLLREANSEMHKPHSIKLKPGATQHGGKRMLKGLRACTCEAQAMNRPRLYIVPARLGLGSFILSLTDP